MSLSDDDRQRIENEIKKARAQGRPIKKVQIDRLIVKKLAEHKAKDSENQPDMDAIPPERTVADWLRAAGTMLTKPLGQPPPSSDVSAGPATEAPSPTKDASLSLVPCRDCGKDVGVSALSCPSCGAERPAVSKKARDTLIQIVVAVSFFAWLLLMLQLFGFAHFEVFFQR